MTQRRWHGNAIAKAALRDTPPVDVIYRGRSPGLRVVALVRLPEACLSDMDGLSLAAYSCGGSFGFKAVKPRPNSLLAPDFRPQNHDDEPMSYVVEGVKAFVIGFGEVTVIASTEIWNIRPITMRFGGQRPPKFSGGSPLIPKS